jgi:hypothetical protein
MAKAAMPREAGDSKDHLMAIKLQWWRVEVDGAGKVVSCRAVDAAGAEGSAYYFEAFSPEQATKQAQKSHDAKLLQARRERYDAEGVCRCGGKRDRPGFKTCSRCSARHKLHEDRKAAKLRGETVAKPDRRTVLLERKRSEADDLRLDVLREVQQAWLNNPTVGAFSRWLNGEVEKLAGKRVA